MNTIDEIVDHLMSTVTNAEVYIICNTICDKVSFARYVRNKYDLWHSSPVTLSWREHPDQRNIVDEVDYSLDHPDNISRIIVEKFIKKVQDAYKTV